MKQKQKENQSEKPKSQRFMEKYIVPSKPRSEVVCYMRDAYKDNEAFIQVVFYNPQDSDMIRVPNSFENLRVRVKVAAQHDKEIIRSWKEVCKPSLQN